MHCTIYKKHRGAKKIVKFLKKGYDYLVQQVFWANSTKQEAFSGK